MKKKNIISLLQILIIFFTLTMDKGVSVALASDVSFKRIKTSDIRKLFSGQEFSDEIHWAERYQTNGTVEGSGSGSRYTKRWLVKDDQICITDEEGEDCREVWVAAKRVELRRWSDDEVPKAGVIRLPRK